jgi:methylmalonyl-CoA mutase cobalamin-binding subunit
MRTVLAGALGEDAHVAGVASFLKLAEEVGWKTVYLGPAVPIERFLESIRRHNPDLVAVSYRLTPETGEALLKQFIEAVRTAGEEPLEEIIAYLKGELWRGTSEKDFPQTFVERLAWKRPFPLIRHHFGRPTVEETIAGIREIADARVLDVISLGIDQDAQENFFHPERQDPRRKGAGGVPVRSAEEYRALYQASRCGNYPLMRAYSGTDDQLRLAQLYVETFNNAWCATSIFWFNQLDRRGPLSLEESFAHHATTAQELIESVKIARRAIENALRGAPDMTADPIVQRRKEELITEAQVTLEAIKKLAGPDVPDPWVDPATLARAVTVGILDAPHLKGSPIAKGQIVTRIVDGMCVAVDPQTGRPLSEAERIARLGITV